jgi:hypothetical protein
MLNPGFSKETLTMSYTGEIEKGVSSTIQEQIFFHKTEDDPHSQALLLVNAYTRFLDKIGLDPMDVYFMLLEDLDKEDLLDILYESAKSGDISNLYTALESIDNSVFKDYDEDDFEKIEKLDSSKIKESQRKQVIAVVNSMRAERGLSAITTSDEKVEPSITLEEFETRCLDKDFKKSEYYGKVLPLNDSFIKYLYQLYLDDIKQ